MKRGVSGVRCLLCHATEFKICLEDSTLKAMSSDCRPWPGMLEVCVCLQCGHVQKQTDFDPAAFYGQYEHYPAGAGSEQLIFQNGTEPPKPRSVQILEKFESNFRLPEQGAILDIGCGNGAFLRSFKNQYPAWHLYGFEQNDRHQEDVRRVPGLKDFFSGSLEGLGELKFDLITLIHVFEHVQRPRPFLNKVRSLLKPGGLLLIQVPNVLANPMDMVLIDHYSHFSPQVLRHFVEGAGFHSRHLAADWIHKEISLCVEVGNAAISDSWFSKIDAQFYKNFAEEASIWLNAVVDEAKHQAKESRIGIFGTAVAGTWLAYNLEDRVQFFVDEDPVRVGKNHLGKPIVHPSKLKQADRVFVAFPYEIAVRIKERLSKSSQGTFLLPPPFSRAAAASSSR